jgi:hypothetical protein
VTNIKKDTRSEYGISLAVGVITAIAGFLLAYNIGILIAISSATLWAFFGFFAAEFLKYASKQKSEREDFLNQMDVKIDTRVGTILEYSALHSKKLEETLVKLRNTSEKRKWIIAKFISRKLSDDFSSLKIEIDGDSYSDFSRNLYSECERSIHVTSPFAPEDWFLALNLDKNGTLQEIRDGVDVSRDRILSLAPHLKAFMDSPAEIKKRLVILSDADWKVLNNKENKDNLNCLKKFLDVEGGGDIETRFIANTNLLKGRLLAKGIDFEKFDYAIFDGELLLKWEKPPKTELQKEMPLYLDIGIPADCKGLMKIFEFDKRDIYKTGDKIVDDIEKGNS